MPVRCQSRPIELSSAFCRFQAAYPMKRTGNWFNDGRMRNRIFNKSSTGPPRPPRSPGYMRRIRAANRLRALLRERRIRRRYSIEKTSSCSNNFSNGGSTRRTCRKEPTLTPVLFAKASDKTRRRPWVLRHAGWSAMTSCFHASLLFDAPQASSKRCRR